ncbi:hypothetical protein JTB14_026984 [Gonioctena quinquepunctata]|nr:hypothetical protein JTB14_026984 [Gonioctena quinquepunctata]
MTSQGIKNMKCPKMYQKTSQGVKNIKCLKIYYRTSQGIKNMKCPKRYNNSVKVDESQQMVVDKVNVWSQKGKTLEDDYKAIELIMELGSSDTFVNRFNDKRTSKLKLWKENYAKRMFSRRRKM